MPDETVGAVAESIATHGMPSWVMAIAVCVVLLGFGLLGMQNRAMFRRIMGEDSDRSPGQEPEQEKECLGDASLRELRDRLQRLADKNSYDHTTLFNRVDGMNERLTRTEEKALNLEASLNRHLDGGGAG